MTSNYILIQIFFSNKIYTDFLEDCFLINFILSFKCLDFFFGGVYNPPRSKKVVVKKL